LPTRSPAVNLWRDNLPADIADLSTFKDRAERSEDSPARGCGELAGMTGPAAGWRGIQPEEYMDEYM
jgi:hypothetical protein